MGGFGSGKRKTILEIDLRVVREMRSQGLSLKEISLRIGFSEEAISTRLRKARKMDKNKLLLKDLLMDFAQRSFGEGRPQECTTICEFWIFMQ